MSRIKNKLLYEKEKAITRLNRSSTRWMRQPTVISMDDTIAAIKERRASIARYGDGEFDIIFGRTQGFQGRNEDLAARLKDILKRNNISERFFVAIPDCFNSLEQFNENAQIHWQIRLDRERIKWVSCLNTKVPYYQAQITRFYFDWKDKSKSHDWYIELKHIWDSENVLIVEGEYSRVGVGNDLFDNAASVRRILCPAENAFNKYSEILRRVKQHATQSDLIFMALGPTATVLAYDLFREGYWAFDAGHIDLEYEWMRQGATEKTIVPGKYTNEVVGGKNVLSTELSEKYLEEIVDRVGIL